MEMTALTKMVACDLVALVVHTVIQLDIVNKSSGSGLLIVYKGVIVTLFYWVQDNLL